MEKMIEKRLVLAAGMAAMIGLSTGCAMLESDENDQVISMNQRPDRENLVLKECLNTEEASVFIKQNFK